jgi:acyl-CoA thioesterase FadM
MKQVLRLSWVIACARFRGPVLALGPCFTPLRCLPSDVDGLKQEAKGKDFSILDLARTDLMIRSGMAPLLSHRGWYPVVVAETIRFCEPMKLFDAFVIESTVLGWDDEGFILQQRILRKDICVAEAVVRAQVMKKIGGSVTPKDVLTAAGVTAEPMQYPQWIREWNAERMECGANALDAGHQP